MSSGDDRAVLITGASTGIGAACAVHLDRIGFTVLAGVRREQDGDALKRLTSDHLVPVLLDVTDESSIQQAKARVSELISPRGLYGLVNNAGVVVASPLEAVPIADLRRQLDINVIGQVAVTQAFLPLIRNARGRIVNMGSIAGRGAIPLMGPYAASKFALEAITDVLRLELQQWGIHVSIVEPGAVATPIWEKSRAESVNREDAATPEMRRLYGTLITSVRKVVEQAAARAIPCDAVTQAVEHALTAVHPKTRYLVGKDAALRALLIKLLPDRLSDKVLTWALNLPR